MTLRLPNKDMRADLIKGAVGIGGVSLGGIVSLNTVQAWLQITSLVVGIAVGVASLISIVKKWPREK